eukprot:COSAG06_NODE_13306_length_1270_cov_1.274979_3_plen_59_part_01
MDLLVIVMLLPMLKRESGVYLTAKWRHLPRHAKDRNGRAWERKRHLYISTIFLPRQARD